MAVINIYPMASQVKVSTNADVEISTSKTRERADILVAPYYNVVPETIHINSNGNLCFLYDKGMDRANGRSGVITDMPFIVSLTKDELSKVSTEVFAQKCRVL